MIGVFQKSALTATFLLQITANQSLAQVTPDSTLGSENSKINSINELRDRIEGGAARGENLFHSFEEFSIREGLEVYFANPEEIKNIFSRVTGNNISEILGTLGVEGAANLFLINPNGIVFGENAAVDMGGSFIATTAESIEFEDGESFSVRDRNSRKPLLTWNAPISLNLGDNPGNISVSGFGHNLSLNTTEATFRFPSFSSLTVKPEKTLALIGGDITINGGVLVAPDGHVELGAVASGKVSFDSATMSNFQYATLSLKNIRLTNESLADTSGFNGGSIQSIGDRIILESGSGFFVQNQLTDRVDNIRVEAKSLEILGGSFRPVFLLEQGLIETTPDSQFVRTGIVNGELLIPGTPISQVLETFGLSLEESESVTSFVPSFIFSEGLQNARGQNIKINTENLLISNGAQLITRSFDHADAGNIDIDEAVNIEVRGASGTPGFAEQSFEIFSQINSINFGSGKGGNLDLKANSLFVSDGGSINSGNNGVGEGGFLSIDANTIDLIGSVPNVFLPSTVSTGTGSDGNAGNLTINADQIFLRDGAAISSSTLAGGNSGEVEVIVRDLISIEGIQSSTQLPSGISSEATLLPAELREAFFLPPFPTGNAGSLSISADKIRIGKAAQISVQNFGTGDAGELQITSNDINISSQGQISAATFSGEGGNITINSDRLSLDNGSISASAGGEGRGGNISLNASDLRATNSNISAESLSREGGEITLNSDRIELQDSFISASAGEDGNGGNIFIDAETVLGINSDITATAVRGAGGNITIEADGVLGFVERDAEPNNGTSDVDASSEFGQDGTVTITNPLTTDKNPLVVIKETPSSEIAPNFVAKCETADGEPLIEDSSTDGFAEVPEDFNDSLEYIPEPTFDSESAMKKFPEPPDPTSIKDLVWQPGKPLVQADQLVLHEGELYLVPKSQVEELEKRGCIEIEAVIEK